MALDVEMLTVGPIAENAFLVRPAGGDKLVVVEVWESQEAQSEFMTSRLGPALGKANAPQPSRAEWFTHIS